MAAEQEVSYISSGLQDQQINAWGEKEEEEVEEEEEEEIERMKSTEEIGTSAWPGQRVIPNPNGHANRTANYTDCIV